jgi:2-polyprenyl-6-methoxyphenol hydroxylase-like FAD-dependent oxidoreductase
VELGVALKRALQKAGGVPFSQLPPEAIAAALRDYEILRSHRVADIINRSKNSGRLFLIENPLVSFQGLKYLPGC